MEKAQKAREEQLRQIRQREILNGEDLRGADAESERREFQSRGPQRTKAERRGETRREGRRSPTRKAELPCGAREGEEKDSEEGHKGQVGADASARSDGGLIDKLLTKRNTKTKRHPARRTKTRFDSTSRKRPYQSLLIQFVGGPSRRRFRPALSVGFPCLFQSVAVRSFFSLLRREAPRRCLPSHSLPLPIRAHPL